MPGEIILHIAVMGRSTLGALQGLVFALYRYTFVLRGHKCAFIKFLFVHRFCFIRSHI